MPLCGQGSGRYQTARTETSATASVDRMSVLRRDSAQPEITNGARMRIEKGFCRPPGGHRRAARSTRSKQSFHNASRSDRKRGVSGRSESVGVDLGGARSIEKKKKLIS